MSRQTRVCGRGSDLCRFQEAWNEVGEGCGEERTVYLHTRRPVSTEHALHTEHSDVSALTECSNKGYREHQTYAVRQELPRLHSNTMAAFAVPDTRGPLQLMHPLGQPSCTHYVPSAICLFKTSWVERRRHGLWSQTDPGSDTEFSLYTLWGLKKLYCFLSLNMKVRNPTWRLVMSTIK